MTQEANENATPETVPTEGQEQRGQLDQRFAQLEAELAESKDRLLRALADTENLRRRSERERDDARRYASQNFAKDLLDVADNLRRALASVEGGGIEDERVKALVDGVAATERALLASFERHGIRRIEPKPGERFDHNLHQAMFEVENSGQPAGSVVQVLQNGYQMHDRLLRPALVGVAKADGADAPGHIDTRA